MKAETRYCFNKRGFVTLRVSYFFIREMGMKLKYGLLCVVAGVATCQGVTIPAKPKIGAPQQQRTAAGGPSARGYQTTMAALQALSSAVPRFAPDNFFLNGVSADGKTVWYGLIAGIQGYVNNQMAQLGRALSARDKDLFGNSMRTIEDVSNQLINDITIIRNSNEQFKKGITMDAWKRAKLQVDKLAARVKELDRVQEALKPQPKDAPIVKDVKKVISMFALTLKITIEKAVKDFSKIVPLHGKPLPALPMKK